MADPTLELQGAIIARLKADAGVTAIVGQHVADIPQAAWPKPYVCIGPSNYVIDDVDCVDGGEVMIQVDCYSEATVLSEIRRLAGAVRSALKDWEPALATNAVVSFDHWRTDHVTNGALKHASLRYTAIVEEQ